MASRTWFDFGPYRFDGRLMYEGGVRVELTEKEAEVLRRLVVNARHLVAKDELLADVFGARADLCSLDTVVSRLRKILRDRRRGNSGHIYIDTVQGGGYVFVHRVERFHEPCADSLRDCGLGLELWNAREPEPLWAAKRHFEQALQQDRGSPLAHAGLADCYAILGTYWWISPADGAVRAKAHAEKALRFDDTLAKPHATLGFVQSLFERRWSAAAREFEHALHRAPDYEIAHHWYALHLAATSQPERAFAEITRARERAPSRSIDVHAAAVPYWSRCYAVAEKACEKALQFHPCFWYAHYQLGLIYEAQGRLPEAVAKQREAVAHFPGESAMLAAALARALALTGEREESLHHLEGSTSPRGPGDSAVFHIAAAQAALGDDDGAFESLWSAIRSNDVWVSFLAVDPRLDTLRRDARFPKLLEHLGLSSSE